MSWSVQGIIPKNKNSNQVGYVLVLISATLAAIVHVLAKPLLDVQAGIEIHPVALAACVYVINAAFFTPLTKKSPPIATLDRKNLLLLSIIGVLEVTALITYFFGLKDSTATNASIFSNGEIVFSLLITMILFKESLHRKEIGPFMMIMLGMMVLPIGYDFYANGMLLSGLVLGDLLIIASGVLYALDVMLCRYLSDKIDSKRITQIVSFVSGTFAVVALIAFHIPFDVQLANLGSIALFAIGGTGLATMLFLISLRLLGGVRTVLLFSTNSIMGVIFAAIILGETISTVNWASVALTFAGVYLLRNRLAAKHGGPIQNEQVKRSA
ncbi:MAG: DMT family transporter [Candidatus Nitrosotenuis sp.]